MKIVETVMPITPPNEIEIMRDEFGRISHIFIRGEPVFFPRWYARRHNIPAIKLK